MKVAVTSTLPTIDASVGTKLRCSKYLLIVDIDTMKYEVMPNPFLAASGSAAGKLVAQQLSEVNVSKVLTNNCGSDVLKSLYRTEIQVISGMSGSVRRVVKQFKEMCMADTIIMPIEDIQE